MKKRIFAILFLILIIGVIVGLVIHHRRSNRIYYNSDTVSGTSAGNYYNGGLFCEKEGVVYFANPSDNYKLYRMSPDGSNLTQLGDDSVSFLNVDDHYIYYARVRSEETSDFAFLTFNTTSLYRVNLDGSSQVVLDEAMSMYVALTGNTLYYIHYDKETASTLYKVGIDGTGLTQVSSEPLLLSPGQQGTLCYSGVSQNGNICLWNPQTDTGTTVLEGVTYHPIDRGDYIYYMDAENDYHLYRYDKSTGDISEVTDCRLDCYNITNEYVYYQKSGDTPALCRISLDGFTGEETVASGTFTDINVTSQYVYFRDYNNQDVFYKTPADDDILVTRFNP